MKKRITILASVLVLTVALFLWRSFFLRSQLRLHLIVHIHQGVTYRHRATCAA